MITASANARAIIEALRKMDVRLCMMSGVGWPCEIMDSGEDALAAALEQCEQCGLLKPIAPPFWDFHAQPPSDAAPIPTNVVLAKLSTELKRRAEILMKDDELSQAIGLALTEVVESIAVAVKP